MFDSLARLVPEELQAAYYRVLAHTRTLSPDDEMLRILEAMGILALLTRHTPKDIADERERIQEMLDAHLQFSDEAQEKMLGYVHFIEGRLAELPSEIEAGLDPQQIAKILGESLRQHFVESGVPIPWQDFRRQRLQCPTPRGSSPEPSLSYPIRIAVLSRMLNQRTDEYLPRWKSAPECWIHFCGSSKPIFCVSGCRLLQERR